MWVSARWAILSGLLIGAEDLLVATRTGEHDFGTVGADGGVKRGIVLAGAHHHRHGHGVAEDQRLLARIERGQHRAQVWTTADAGEDRVDVLLVVELTGDT